MCQIISVPAGKEVNIEHLDAAQEHNKDGYGVAWYENSAVQTFKTMDYNIFKALVKELTPYTKILHLRYNTVGETNLENCHPFKVTNGVMFHNGTISSMKPTGKWDKHQHKYITPKGSDSLALAKLLDQCWYETVFDIEPLIISIIGNTINKLAFLEDDGSVVIMNEELGIEEDGIWYSNDYHIKNDGWCRHGSCSPKKEKLKEVKQVTYSFNNESPKETPSKLTTKVFVYGTLKKGLGNHHLLKDASFLGDAQTTSKWAMIGKDRAFPYVVEPKDSGYKIKGEVYEVTTQQLYELDRLEGVSYNHYKKVPITVKYEDGSNEFVTMYVACKKPYGYDTAELLEEWTHAKAN